MAEEQAQTYSLSFSTQYAQDADYLLIEQEPWPEDVGVTTHLQAIAAISSFLFDTTVPEINCGGDTDGFDTLVYVYPSRVSLIYTFHISHGEYIRGISEMLIREETQQAGLNDSVQVDYPPISSISIQWIGQCYDSTGAVTARPLVTVVGNTIYFSKKVYGSLRLRYSVLRITYKVRVEERDDAVENNFDSIVFCVWDGGIKWLRCDPPSGYEATKGECDNGFYDTDSTDGDDSMHIGDQPDGSPDEDEDPNQAPDDTDGADLRVGIDYCSQELLFNKAVGNNT